jgi:16S rRNA (cytosine967-C5)-methyltransferase
LAKAGVPIYNVFIADISNFKFQIPNSKFNLIICDAPCSGSGTWGRTPEQLYFFKQNDIAKYVQLQRQITTNTLKHLAPNGYFLYITCSVFKQENEQLVDFILQQNPQLTVIKQDVLIGYEKKADTMFAALFQLKG